MCRPVSPPHTRSSVSEESPQVLAGRTSTASPGEHGDHVDGDLGEDDDDRVADDCVVL